MTSAAGALTTNLLLRKWREPGPGNTYGSHVQTAKTVQTWNFISVGVLAASYAAGVIDAFVRSDHEPEDQERSVSLLVFPGGAGIGGRF